MSRPRVTWEMRGALDKRGEWVIRRRWVIRWGDHVTHRDTLSDAMNFANRVARRSTRDAS